MPVCHNAGGGFQNALGASVLLILSSPEEGERIKAHENRSVWDSEDPESHLQRIHTRMPVAAGTYTKGH